MGAAPLRHEFDVTLVIFVRKKRSAAGDCPATRQGKRRLHRAPFKMNRTYAEAFAARWVILSAKYGFISPDALIPGPYNVTFKKCTTNPVGVARLIEQIKELRLNEVPKIIGLGGKEYRAMIESAFASFPCCLSFPFSGLPIGLAMQATKRAIQGGNSAERVHLAGGRNQEREPPVSRRCSVTTDYGFKTEDWQKAKEEMRQILIEKAKTGQTIPYTDLVAQVKAIDLPRNSPALWHMLGEISTEENAAQRGMLTVIVIHGKGDTLPGAGFFKLAKKLGRVVSDKTAFWMEELGRVYGSWSTTGEKTKPKAIIRSYWDDTHQSHPASSTSKVSAKLKYPGRSGFIEALRKGVNAAKPRLVKGHPVEIQMKLGGWQGKVAVIINADDPNEFEVAGAIKDPDQISRRIRVAAWALFQEKVFGRFIIEYDRKSGVLTIHRDG